MTLSELLIPEREYAAQRGVCLRTVQRERYAGKGPDYVRLGRQVFYRPAAIEKHLEALEVEQPRARKRRAA